MRWKYSPFLRVSPWRDPRIRHFAGYPFGASRKKASTIFYNAALKFQTINPQNTSVMASANGKIRPCHSIWLLHLHSALKIQPFYPAFPLTESIAKTFFGFIPLELQGKNISHFPWHSQNKNSLPSKCCKNTQAYPYSGSKRNRLMKQAVTGHSCRDNTAALP